ncbi:MAG: contractile injection system tape measure protein [Bacteroidota bacterium]
MNNHIIRRFELELHVSDKESGRIIQDEILLEYKQQIINEISDRFDKLIGPDEYLTIDSLTIDAGHISLEHRNELLTLQLVDALELQLRKLLETARQQPGEKVSLYQSDASGGSVEITVQLKTATYSRLELLWQLLVNGILPWQSSNNIGVEQLVKELINENKINEVLIALQQQGRGNGFLRLAKQLSLKTLLQLFSNEKQQQLAEIIYKHIASVSGQAAAESFMAAMLQVNRAQSTTNNDVISELMLGNLHTDYLFRPALAKLIVIVSDTNTSSETALKTALEISSTDAFLIRETLQTDSRKEDVLKKSIQIINDKDRVEQKQKSGSEQDSDLPDDTLIITNAGLVLLHPFINTFLSRTGHIENREFISDRAKEEAAVLLQLLVTGMPDQNSSDENSETNWFEEHQLLLNKILVGLPLETPLPGLSAFSRTELETFSAEADKAVQHAINSWPLLSRTTVAAFREMFLKHEGRLSAGSGGWDLQIERDSFDVLIDKLPWPISIIRHPWSEKTLFVTW